MIVFNFYLYYNKYVKEFYYEILLYRNKRCWYGAHYPSLTVVKKKSLLDIKKSSFFDILYLRMCSYV